MIENIAIRPYALVDAPRLFDAAFAGGWHGQSLPYAMTTLGMPTEPQAGV